MITKKGVKEQLKSLPEEFTIDELVEKLILIQKIEKGIEQSNSGDVISEAAMDKKISEW